MEGRAKGAEGVSAAAGASRAGGLQGQLSQACRPPSALHSSLHAPAWPGLSPLPVAHRRSASPSASSSSNMRWSAWAWAQHREVGGWVYGAVLGGGSEQRPVRIRRAGTEPRPAAGPPSPQPLLSLKAVRPAGPRACAFWRRSSALSASSRRARLAAASRRSCRGQQGGGRKQLRRQQQVRQGMLCRLPPSSQIHTGWQQQPNN